jgi:dihydropteroate synthase
MLIRTKRYTLDLSKRTVVMGVLNVTPDSFSDGGRYDEVDKAVYRALQMFREGAEIVDVGGESTGPGSGSVSEVEELRRVLPMIQEILKRKPDACLSIDTYKSSVAERCLAAGVSMVNDVMAGRTDPGIFDVVAEYGCPYILMYSKDATPRTTREEKQYEDVIATIFGFFKKRLAAAKRAGIKASQLILDPGMGAFVSGIPRYSFEILARLKEFQSFHLPLLVSPGRKSFLAGDGNLPPEERLEGTLAASAVAVLHGANIIRTHDVKETKHCLDVVEGIQKVQG